MIERAMGSLEDQIFVNFSKVEILAFTFCCFACFLFGGFHLIYYFDLGFSLFFIYSFLTSPLLAWCLNGSGVLQVVELGFQGESLWRRDKIASVYVQDNDNKFESDFFYFLLP
ncbi:hypothetical protein SLEP1_g41244 [Rubroshorea leprosula]|uniref:Uncharacterized protein n=1 Tax=Rubroshorea leprosula TaxID=152421 RepID=A0AAV5L6U4_9ROSI|nr:hypothetical protein SLEP1_g41244 [Rubroshorea leprosula]